MALIYCEPAAAPAHATGGLNKQKPKNITGLYGLLIASDVLSSFVRYLLSTVTKYNPLKAVKNYYNCHMGQNTRIRYR